MFVSGSTLKDEVYDNGKMRKERSFREEQKKSRIK